MITFGQVSIGSVHIVQENQTFAGEHTEHLNQ